MNSASNSAKTVSVGHRLLAFVGATTKKFCRDFGLLMALVFVVLAIWQPRHGIQFNPVRLAVALGLGTVSVVFPRLFLPAAALWRALAMILHIVVSPIVLFVLYYVIVTPFGLVFSLFGWDPLRLRKDEKLETYWISRNPPGPQGDAYRRQF